MGHIIFAFSVISPHNSNMMHGDTGAIYLVDRPLYRKGNTAGKNGTAKRHRGLDI